MDFPKFQQKTKREFGEIWPPLLPGGNIVAGALPGSYGKVMELPCRCRSVLCLLNALRHAHFAAAVKIIAGRLDGPGLSAWEQPPLWNSKGRR